MTSTVPVSEICDALAMSEPTVRKWIAKGLLPGYQLEPKGRVIVPRAAWNRFLNGEWQARTTEPVTVPTMLHKRDRRSA